MTIFLMNPEVAEKADRHWLSVVGGLGAVLDAMTSAAYGPEAIVIVLAVAGSAGLGFTVTVTLGIALLVGVLTLSYRQVIAAFPDGGGAYGVSRGGCADVGVPRVAALHALAVTRRAGAGHRGEPARERRKRQRVHRAHRHLRRRDPHRRRGRPAADGTAVATITPGHVRRLQSIGILLLLKASQTAVPRWCRVDRQRGPVVPQAAGPADPAVRDRPGRAARGHAPGIATLIEKLSIHPVDGVTVLSQVTTASLGDGFGFRAVQFSTVVLLVLAANTSFGGLPVLAQLLAKHNNPPHVFALRAERQVYRCGVDFLASSSALLLIASDRDLNTLVPLFAIGDRLELGRTPAPPRTDRVAGGRPGAPGLPPQPGRAGIRTCRWCSCTTSGAGSASRWSSTCTGWGTGTCSC
ncbi:hypothetical protein [Amycolatopsis nalaikhensis]|uniref:Amino acid transporter n=1 Tax=Amycolatopsis nalaikhensis TaxID=715472 RepID=A0ABY8XUT4_9PSEU|nr:hypothetical protein [Amycolatopsis sp. 2-2]WIV59246.1 hypothetical protein QP939_11760 [Amycolatopsis sp. 2-2]